MNLKQLIALSTLAFAGSAALADDITIVADTFVATKTRAEVQAEVLKARARGEVFASEVDLTPTMAAKVTSSATRDAVRAELRSTPRVSVMVFNPAA